MSTVDSNRWSRRDFLGAVAAASAGAALPGSLRAEDAKPARKPKIKPAPLAKIQAQKKEAPKKAVKGPAKTAPKSREKPKPKAKPRSTSGWARVKPRSVSKTRKRAAMGNKKKQRR